MNGYETLADVIRDRDEGEYDELWSALMVCGDCPHRMIDHDQLAMRCLVCRCDQRQRGLSAHADERLMTLGTALREVYPAAGDRDRREARLVRGLNAIRDVAHGIGEDRPQTIVRLVDALLADPAGSPVGPPE